METVRASGLMALGTWVSGNTMKCMEMDILLAPMGVIFAENGDAVLSMVVVPTDGQMAVLSAASMRMTKSMDLVYSNGMMAGLAKAIGRQESSMALAGSVHQTV